VNASGSISFRLAEGGGLAAILQPSEK